MREEDWKKVDEDLNHIYGLVKLRCDGFVLTLELWPIGRFNNAIRFYVNGAFLVRWGLEDCEERRRFFCPSKSRLWSGKARKDFARIGKRTLKKFNIDPYASATYYRAYWTSFRRMKAHLSHNNEIIELMEPEAEV